MEKLLPSKRWSYIKSKCLLRENFQSLEIYPHRTNVPLLPLAASLKVDFGLHKELVLPLAKDFFFFSYSKRFDNIRHTMKHIPNMLMTQDLDAKYNSLVPHHILQWNCHSLCWDLPHTIKRIPKSTVYSLHFMLSVLSELWALWQIQFLLPNPTLPWSLIPWTIRKL